MTIEAPPLERKLVAILSADAEGYSRLMHVDEEGTLSRLSSHRTIIDRLIAARGGHITSTAGDSVLAEFASVVEAVVCAVEMQQALEVANEALDPARRLVFRVGINVGDVMVKDGGIFGDGVNVAARVQQLAPPGGICVTRGVRDHVLDRLPHDFEDLGDHSVKNIARPIHVFRMTVEAGDRSNELRSAGSVVDRVGTAIDSADAEVTFWRSAERGGTVEEYRAYLDRYPSGTFRALAEARLYAPVDEDKTKDISVELAFWDAVVESGDAAHFAAYLDKYPDGEFRAIAELKIAGHVGAKHLGD